MGLLIRSNDIDLYALHYVYMPRINTALTQLVNMALLFISYGFLDFCSIIRPIILVFEGS